MPHFSNGNLVQMNFEQCLCNSIRESRDGHQQVLRVTHEVSIINDIRSGSCHVDLEDGVSSTWSKRASSRNTPHIVTHKKTRRTQEAIHRHRQTHRRRQRQKDQLRDRGELQVAATWLLTLWKPAKRSAALRYRLGLPAASSIDPPGTHAHHCCVKALFIKRDNAARDTFQGLCEERGCRMDREAILTTASTENLLVPCP